MSGTSASGSGGGFNVNWDGDWQVRTKVFETGWSAEFAIPFRTLRYPQGRSQAWGLNIQRNIRRRNESSFWAPIPRQFTLYRLSLAGELRGIEVPAQRNLKITPYVLGKLEYWDQDATTSRIGDIGGDLKYSITPSLTLDATYNTDFAQVEVDDQQINLNRLQRHARPGRVPQQGGRPEPHPQVQPDVRRAGLIAGRKPHAHDP